MQTGALLCLQLWMQLSRGSTLTVIDIPARKPSRTIDLQQYRRPHGIAWLCSNEVVVTTAQRIRTARTGSLGTIARSSPTSALAPCQ